MPPEYVNLVVAEPISNTFQTNDLLKMLDEIRAEILGYESVTPQVHAVQLTITNGQWWTNPLAYVKPDEPNAVP